jgi:hypothetical protein
VLQVSIAAAAKAKSFLELSLRSDFRVLMILSM